MIESELTSLPPVVLTALSILADGERSRSGSGELIIGTRSGAWLHDGRHGRGIDLGGVLFGVYCGAGDRARGASGLTVGRLLFDDGGRG
jgi:hypothetical protein